MFFLCVHEMGCFGIGNLFCLLFRRPKTEKSLDKFKCWNSTSCFWATGVALVPVWGSGFEESLFLVRSALLCTGCAAGAHPLCGEVSFVATNQEQLFCVYSITEIESLFHRRTVGGH